MLVVSRGLLISIVAPNVRFVFAPISVAEVAMKA
jgi:hypothetical protein